MKLKDNVRKKLEKVFKDAGFNVRLDVYVHQSPVYPMGSIMPITLFTEITVSATVPLKESDMEWEE